MRSLLTLFFVFLTAQLGASDRIEVSLYRVCASKIEYPNELIIHLDYWDGQNTLGEPEPVCLENPALSSGYLISGAEVITGEPHETYALKLILSDTGLEVFKVVSIQNEYKRIAMVVENKILTSATFVEPIKDREFVLRGIGRRAFKISEVFNGH